MDITNRLVRFWKELEYEKIPSYVIQKQKNVLIDNLSVMEAATRLEPSCRDFVRYAEQYSKPGKSTVLGGDMKVMAPFAALANGALAHALDYEDSHDTAFVHSNAVTIPSLLAVAEEMGNVDGKRFLTAMVIGSEVTCRLALGLNKDLLNYGWYMPPIHGSIGAVFAVAKLMDLPEEQLLDAVALNMNMYTCSGEVVNSRHSVIRLVRDGFAAQAAVTSCMMAKNGIRAGFEQPFEGNKGYYMAYARGNVTWEKIVDGLGGEWESAKVSMKPWPCCRATHTTLTGLKGILKEHRIKQEEIKEIHIKAGEILRMVLEEHEVKYHPESIMNAKMSIPFAVGLLLADGDVTLDGFKRERLQDETVSSFAEKVTYEILPETDRTRPQAVEITVLTEDGKRYCCKAEHPLGSMENPMELKDIYKKYCQCMGYSYKVMKKGAIEELFKRLSCLETCDNINEIIKML